MIKLASLGLVAAAGIALASGPATAMALAGQQYAGEARVSLQDARATALKAAPGQITAQELEKEAGGSGLRYSFDVKLSGITHEVGVDANTGALLENSIEGPHPD
jgi:uncharacterized membrane protein YkoI